jgi:hypothetical protein
MRFQARSNRRPITFLFLFFFPSNSHSFKHAQTEGQSPSFFSSSSHPIHTRSSTRKQKANHLPFSLLLPIQFTLVQARTNTSNYLPFLFFFPSNSHSLAMSRPALVLMYASLCLGRVNGIDLTWLCDSFVLVCYCVPDVLCHLCMPRPCAHLHRRRVAIFVCVCVCDCCSTSWTALRILTTAAGRAVALVARRSSCFP